ncbi:MAG: hypothetical protein CMH83_11760 [Nocardioides sp.]|nr:hypothetical protein [Nocardioides sp.]
MELDSSSGVSTRRVAAAVAGKPADAAVVRAAVDAARARGAGLDLIHVAASVSTGGWMPAAIPEAVALGRRVLGRAVRDAHRDAPDLEVTGTLRTCAVVSDLVDASRGLPLLVVGREGRRGWSRAVLGPVTTALAAHAMCPVRVVPPARPEPSGPVVVAVFDVDGAERLVVHAALATPRGARLLVHHRPEGLTRWGAVADLLAAARTARPDIVVEAVVDPRDRSESLLDLSVGASLVVVGRRRGVLGERLGRTTRRLLDHAYAPVEVVPA